MWAQYRRTFLMTQILVAAAILVLTLVVKAPAGTTLVFVVVMELCAFAGAAWAARIKRKVDAQFGFLPSDKL